LRVDDAIEGSPLLGVVAQALFAAVQPLLQGSRREKNRRDQVRDALSRDLEAALRCRRTAAFRQYDAADPRNRLVAE